MWQGYRYFKKGNKKMHKIGGYVDEQSYYEQKKRLDEEEQLTLDLLSNDNYILWMDEILNKFNSIEYDSFHQLYFPNQNISEEDKNNILMIEIFIYGLYLYMWDFNTGMWKKDLETKMEKTDDKGYITEIKEIICLKYKDNYYNIGKKIIPEIGIFEYCEKGIYKDNYIDFEDVISYYKRVKNRREKINKLVRRKK